MHPLTGEMRARMESLLGEYERLQGKLSAARAEMREITGQAHAADGSVTVRVNAQGVLTGLELDPKAYRRLSPSQLAAEILRLADEARADVTRRMSEIVAPFLPQGVDYAQLVGGETALSAVLPPQPLTNETFDEWRARFSGRPDAG
jgi:DNA-binding protein YbaB